MKLREYQTDAIRNLRACYAQGRRSPVLVMPTGSGKTRVAAEIMISAAARSRRVLFFARRIELLDQTVRTLVDCGVTGARVIQAGRDVGAGEIVVASSPTLVTDRWADSLPPADLVIWDECHGIKARTQLDLHRRYSTSFHLGLTATPARGDGSPLGDVFDAIVTGATVAQLVELEHLVPSRVFAPAEILDSRTLALEPVDAYFKHVPGEKAIVFAATVEHARRLAQEFCARGVRCEHVSGDMRTRPEIVARYQRNEIRVIVNVGILVEGFDDPPTSAAILARRFTHAGPYLQACGRTLRPADGKTRATIIDLCGSALVHGTPDADRVFSLDGKGISKADRVALRQCPSCGGVFAARDVCPYCDEQMPTAARSLPTASGVGVGELAPKTKPTSWPMRAKKRSLCAGCGQGIEPGTWIMYSAARRTAQHTGCAAKSAARRAA